MNCNMPPEIRNSKNNTRKKIMIISAVVIIVSICLALILIISTNKSQQISNSQGLTFPAPYADYNYPDDIKKEDVEAIIEQQNLIYGDQDTDTDKDGLMDWEEQLWKSDLSNPDTDGDGTMDGEEVRLGRDPVKPRDDYRQISIDTTSSINPMIEISYDSINTNPPTQIDKNTPAITTDNDFNKYGNAIGKILVTFAQYFSDEASTFDNAIKSPTASAISAFTTVSLRYSKLAEELSEINPPEQMKDLHMTLIKHYRDQSRSIEGLSEYSSQGTVPSSAFQNHNKTVYATSESFLNIGKFYKEKGIKFDGQDAGAIFNLK